VTKLLKCLINYLLAASHYEIHRLGILSLKTIAVLTCLMPVWVFQTWRFLKDRLSLVTCGGSSQSYVGMCFSQRLVSPGAINPVRFCFQSMSFIKCLCLGNIGVIRHPLISFWGYCTPGQWRSFWPSTASGPHPIRTLGCGPDGLCCKLPQFEQIPSHPRPIH